MGYRSDVQISTTKRDYQRMIDYCSSQNLEYDLMNPKNHVIFKEDENNIVFGWEWIKWYDSYPDVNSIVECLDEFEEENIPYIFCRIGENTDDTDEIYFGDTIDLIQLSVVREFYYE